MTVLVTTHYMDEAEQCDRLAYIAYGNLMVKGTVAEVIASSNLTTYSVKGEGIEGLVDELREQPGVVQVVPFGKVLHVSGRDAGALAEVARRYADRSRWQETEAGLEDVFISLMSGAKDNFK